MGPQNHQNLSDHCRCNYLVQNNGSQSTMLLILDMTLASEDTKSMLLDQSLAKLTAKVDSLYTTCNSLMTISIDPNILNFYRTQVDMYRHLSLIGGVSG